MWWKSVAARDDCALAERLILLLKMPGGNQYPGLTGIAPTRHVPDIAGAMGWRQSRQDSRATLEPMMRRCTSDTTS